MAAGPLFIVVEKNVKPSHGTQEKGLKCTGKNIILVGISATMCHIAEKIPAKEGFLSKSANMFK